MSTPSVSIVPFQSSLYWECVALRDEVLRRPLGLEFSDEELLREVDAIHLACHVEEQLVGCLMLVAQTAELIKMRQVAVAPAWQGQGVGRALVEFAERLARERGFSSVTLHARDGAVAFYERLGYERVGQPFEEVSIPHWEMRKTL